MGRKDNGRCRLVTCQKLNGGGPLISMFCVLGGFLEPKAGSHGVSSLKSQVWHGCLHNNTFWRWGLGQVLRVRSSKKLDPTLHISPVNCFVSNNQDPPLKIDNHILTISWGSKVGILPPCWDLLTWVGLGTPCEPALTRSGIIYEQPETCSGQGESPQIWSWLLT